MRSKSAVGARRAARVSPPPQPFGIEQRPETGQNPLRDQPGQPVQQVLFRKAQGGGNGKKRALANVDAVLQAVDQGTIEDVKGRHDRRSP